MLGCKSEEGEGAVKVLAILVRTYYTVEQPFALQPEICPQTVFRLKRVARIDRLLHVPYID